MSSSKRKKERRKARHDRNVKAEQEHKTQAWERGKLIEENHNQGPYSENYTKALAERLVEYVTAEQEKSPEQFVVGFRKYKMKIQDLILHWNPLVQKGPEYQWLKRLLEVYWDNVVGGEHEPRILKEVRFGEL